MNHNIVLPNDIEIDRGYYKDCIDLLKKNMELIQSLINLVEKETVIVKYKIANQKIKEEKLRKLL